MAPSSTLAVAGTVGASAIGATWKAAQYANAAGFFNSHPWYSPVRWYTSYGTEWTWAVVVMAWSFGLLQGFLVGVVVSWVLGRKEQSSQIMQTEFTLTPQASQTDGHGQTAVAVQWNPQFSALPKLPHQVNLPMIPRSTAFGDMTWPVIPGNSSGTASNSPVPVLALTNGPNSPSRVAATPKSRRAVAAGLLRSS